MKKLLILPIIFLCFNQTMQAQESHLSLIYDFDGDNFDYSVKGMVGTNDSLYILSFTPNMQGVFFRIDENGDGYEAIWEFDNINYLPNSIIGNDTAIYITTRFSQNSGGALFKYSLKDYSFELVKDFSPEEAQEVSIKYVTDSVLWFSSLWSWGDEGSIFTTNLDGTGFKKIYNDTNQEKGLMPADFFFHEDKIYIAFFGGGTPYPDGNGGFTSSGSFIRINADGTGYENIIPGGDHVGTAAQSLIIREDKIFGLFAYSGSHHSLGAQFFRSNLDGSSYDSLGALNNRALTQLLSTDSLIYGISAYNVFGINPFDGEIRIFDDLLSNPDFGEDVVSNPAFLNGDVFIATQQGGPNAGGTILKWLNKAPEVAMKDVSNGRQMGTEDIDLNKLFTDPNGDRLTYKFEYDHELVTITESKGILSWVLKTSDLVEVKIIATDGWAGYNNATITLNSSVITNVDKLHEQEFTLFPNPTHSVLKFTLSTVESIQILGLDGQVHESFLNPRNEINISSLSNGMYFVRSQIHGVSYWQKIIKY